MKPDETPDTAHDVSQEQAPRGDADDERRQADCFAPPQAPCECWCMHCGRTFMSDTIWLQKVRGSRDGFDGFWMCPTPNCAGAGFTFDIFPTDPHHPANEGWQSFDDDEEIPFAEDDEENEEFLDCEDENLAEEYNPEEPYYRSLDESNWAEEDMDGEEWKLGLQPGERPEVQPPPHGIEPCNEAEQEALYNAPDRRPREVDGDEREQNFPMPRAPEGQSWGPDDEIPF